MIRAALVISALAAPLLFPWPFAGAIALLAGAFSPLVLLAVGIITDALYLSSGASSIPWWTLLGGIAAAVALLMRHFVETSIMRA